MTKTKELVDFRQPKLDIDPVTIKGEHVEIVQTYKMDDKLNWTANTGALCRKRLFSTF